MSPTRIEWSDLPDSDDPSVPGRELIGAALAKRPGRYAIVGRHDRITRAETHAARIESGREYGSGYSATVRRVGNEHRVYARKDA